ncbi:DUF3237 family protein [Pseudobacteroides cellulosolvens]|uniref:DUF3237 domain-containing protein n=1 Tax=Pseudobacteroides cellulosolvens ATCC 35603 = DSM 2933 TaxID=398512 RepID=A0A0L6JPV5_9FIRM|nr:DUF3237 family protein [Pseudobacteroides cellulosolvens]KNY27813.1 putative protein family UPF0311 [Pseudobacteroides cellulosolvens ATCC 35603 = DSM 2933]
MKFEEVFTVHVKPENAIKLNNDYGDTVVMIPFTGEVTGKYFEGNVLSGGVDTQIIGKDGNRNTLSARYMLEGKDYTGEPCKIYIENNGNIYEKRNNVLFRTCPKIITNSKVLECLIKDLLIGEGIETENGLDIKIYRAI